MSIVNVHVSDDKRKKLKTLASLQDKTLNDIIEDLIDRYIQEYRENKSKRNEEDLLMKASEPSFNEWDNPEDEVYNDL
jgi:mRNA-degrading endonuclease RelE of RelBE toxin-antitoxin system